MKRVEGEDLASWLKAVGAPTSRESQVRVLDILRSVCDAVAFAHSRGILHTDLKPSNLMLGDHGEIYVVDWGNAVHRKRWKRGLRTISGTPAYMSPEQANGEPLSPRTDVFGMGACLYTLLVGTSPRSRNAMAALKQALRAPAHRAAGGPPGAPRAHEPAAAVQVHRPRASAGFDARPCP